MKSNWLSPLQQDALQEVTNIAIGQAGNSLAQVLDRFVQLSAPVIQVMQIDEVARRMRETVGADVLVNAVRQSFIGQLRGEALLLVAEPACGEFAEMLGYEGTLSPAHEAELTLELSNILLGACLCGISRELGTDVAFSAPQLAGERVPVSPALFPRSRLCTHALLVEILLSLEGSAFRCHLLMLMTEQAMETLRLALEKYLEAVLSAA